ncbi:site-specific integrase [Derxia lacustris]
MEPITCPLRLRPSFHLPLLPSVSLLGLIRCASAAPFDICIYWLSIKAYVRFHGLRHPREMGAPEVEAFLTHLAVERRVAASTHRQALSALVLLRKLDELGRPRLAILA